MKKKRAVVVIVVLLLLSGLLLGAAWIDRNGYERGRRETNLWWVEQKSIYYDTNELLKRARRERHNYVYKRLPKEGSLAFKNKPTGCRVGG